MKREAERKKEKKKEELRSIAAACAVFRPFWAQTQQSASQPVAVVLQAVRSPGRQLDSFVHATSEHLTRLP